MERQITATRPSRRTAGCAGSFDRIDPRMGLARFDGERLQFVHQVASLGSGEGSAHAEVMQLSLRVVRTEQE